MSINIRAGAADGALQYNGADAVTVTATGATVQGSLQTNALSSGGIVGNGYSAVLAYQNNGTPTNSSVALVTARGTLLSPTATQGNDLLGNFDFFGYNGAAYAYAASIDIQAASTFTGSNYQSQMNFNLTPAGTTATALAASLGWANGLALNVPLSTNAVSASYYALAAWSYNNAANGTGIQLGGARGTIGSPVATGAGDVLGNIDFYGFGTANVEGAAIDAIAGSAWTVANAETYLSLFTTPLNSITALERMRIASTGAVLVGTTTIPASGSTSATLGDIIVANGGMLSLGTEAAGAYNFTGLGYSTANNNNASISFKSQTRGAAVTSANDTIGNQDYFGWTGSAYGYAASMDVNAAATWSANNTPTLMTFNLTPVGTATPVVTQIMSSTGAFVTLGANSTVASIPTTINTTLGAAAVGYSAIHVTASGAGAAPNASTAYVSSRGTTAAPSATQAGDRLGNFDFFGYGTTWAYSASLDINAFGTFTGTSTPTNMAFNLTVPGMTAPTLVANLLPLVNSVNGNAATFSTGALNLTSVTNDTYNDSIVMTAYGTNGLANNSGIAWKNARGTAAAPTAVQTGDSLGDMDFYGHNGTGFGYTACMDIIAASNWTPASTPSYLNINVTPTGANTWIQAAQVTTANAVTGMTGVISSGVHYTSNVTAVGATVSPATNGNIAGLQAGGYSGIHYVYQNGTTQNASVAFATVAGTQAAPTVTLANQTIGNMDFWGYSGTQWAYAGAIDCVAASTNFTGANYGTIININTTATGATAPAVAATFQNTGVAITGNLSVAGATATSVSAEVTAATYTQLGLDADLMVNYAGTVTLTLINPATVPGRYLTVRTYQAQLVNSAGSNISINGVVGTAMLAATAGKWAKFKSDGTNWEMLMNN